VKWTRKGREEKFGYESGARGVNPSYTLITLMCLGLARWMRKGREG